VRNVLKDNLAWALIEAAKAHLNILERHEEEQYHRRLPERFLMPCAIQASAADWTSRRLRTSKSVEPLRFSDDTQRSVTAIPRSFREYRAALFEQGQAKCIAKWAI